MIKDKLSKFNDYIADRLSLILSMMATFYIVSLLVIIPLFYGTPTSVVLWAQYLCSVVFQGIALPVLGYTARKSSDKTDKMLLEMYKMTSEIKALTEKLESQEILIQKEVEQILENK